MSTVKLKLKGQMTLPVAIRERAGLNVGDLLRVAFERGKITLTPQSLIDREIAEGLADIKRGRVHGPFSNADDAIRFLHQHTKRRAGNQ